MIAHTIVYVILSVLSVTAVYAATTPTGKPTQEQAEPEAKREDNSNSL